MDNSVRNSVYSVYMPMQIAESSTAERILGAAEELLDREGAGAVTMRRVAGTVGITAMAVYRHYPNREGLLDAVADAGFADFRERLVAVRGGSTDERLTALLDVWLDFALEKPRLFELMFLTKRPGHGSFRWTFGRGHRRRRMWRRA